MSPPPPLSLLRFFSPSPLDGKFHKNATKVIAAPTNNPPPQTHRQAVHAHKGSSVLPEVFSQFSHGREHSRLASTAGRHKNDPLRPYETRQPQCQDPHREDQRIRTTRIVLQREHRNWARGGRVNVTHKRSHRSGIKYDVPWHTKCFTTGVAMDCLSPSACSCNQLARGHARRSAARSIEQVELIDAHCRASNTVRVPHSKSRSCHPRPEGSIAAIYSKQDNSCAQTQQAQP